MTWTLERTVGPAIEPVTLDEIIAHLRLTDGVDDIAGAQAYAIVAREAIEVQDLSRALMTQTFKLRLDHWPYYSYGSHRCEIRVPRPPLQSVSEISYLDTEGVSHVLATDQYVVDIYPEPARIVPAYGVAWPSLRPMPAAVTVTYIAGWTDRGKVPERIRQAIKLLTGELWENREATTIDAAVERIPTFAYLLASERCTYDFGRDCG